MTKDEILALYLYCQTNSTEISAGNFISVLSDDFAFILVQYTEFKKASVSGLGNAPDADFIF